MQKFQSQFSMSEMIPIFPFFQLKNTIVGAIFFYWHYLTTSIFKPLYFLKWRPIFMTFTQLTTRLKNLLMGWLLVLGLKKSLVKCAKVCESVRSKWGHTNPHRVKVFSVLLGDLSSGYGPPWQKKNSQPTEALMAKISCCIYLLIPFWSYNSTEISYFTLVIKNELGNIFRNNWWEIKIW